ncbi:MAG: chemotaxis protein CheD [Bacillota bacterium]
MARVLVRTADLAVGCRGDVLVTEFVGSCVVVLLHDSVAAVGGMAHVLLDSSVGTDGWLCPGKFADIAVSALVEAMERCGALRLRMTARIAGGANMFSGGGEALDIGTRNIEAVRKGLAALSIPVVAADVGGSRARSVVFDVSTGAVSVRAGETRTWL